ncbi:MAG: hypothetical protein M1833_003958 [Piccolia ochrophora]|nr:MAG: hypothetical protein M1833_003958 [Piccolia ochrophora]
MASPPISLQWSAQFSVSTLTRVAQQLLGDKILLPPSALEQLLSAASIVDVSPVASHSSTSNFDPFNPYSFAGERLARAQQRDQQHQLPHPLTFRLVNSQNGRIVHAGIREFSAKEGEVVLSPFLQHALGIEDSPDARQGLPVEKEHSDMFVNDANVNGIHDGDRTEDRASRIAVHAKQLPKGTYVRLRPLEAGYDPEDWKALLEQHLRMNFTTMTKGEVFKIPGGRGIGTQLQEFQFLIDRVEPEGDGICIIDTDLEVDIEALNEEQARETLQRRYAKSQKAPGTLEGSSPGGNLALEQSHEGQVRPGEYVDYTITQWDRLQSIEVELEGEDGEEVDLCMSSLNALQRARPRIDEHLRGDFSSQYPKRITMDPTNVEMEHAEELWVSVYASLDASEERGPRKFSVRVRSAPSDIESSDEPPSVSNVRCKNCQQWVPQPSMMLHENFCFRNNTFCPQCRNVFKKTSPDWLNHWHCPHDTYYGSSEQSKRKHDLVFHTPQPCPNCPYQASSVRDLAAHRTSICPGKLILCRFCKLIVPQEGDPNNPSVEALMANLTPHELADGARTTDCHFCGKIIRLREMEVHVRHHDLQRLSRPKPTRCRNPNCGRSVRSSQAAKNDMGLCSFCFGPLYVTMYDPEQKALKRRIERRYLTQLLSGCGNQWCRNDFCRTGRQSLGVDEGQTLAAKDALPLVKPFVEAFNIPTSPLHFCVDESSQRRRTLAEMMSAEPGAKGGYDIEWCVAALEAEGGDADKAKTWLGNWAPERNEAKG